MNTSLDPSLAELPTVERFIQNLPSGLIGKLSRARAPRLKRVGRTDF